MTKEKRKIRTTIVLELPYDNELLNYGNKLRAEILRVLADGNFAFAVQTGSDLPTNIGVPINGFKEVQS